MVVVTVFETRSFSTQPCPRAHYVDQAGHNERDEPASVSECWD